MTCEATLWIYTGNSVILTENWTISHEYWILVLIPVLRFQYRKPVLEKNRYFGFPTHRSQWSKKTSKGHMVRIKARLFILYISCLLHDTHLMAQLMPVACDCLSVVSLYSDRKHVMSTSQVSYTLFTYTVGLILYYLLSWYIRYILSLKYCCVMNNCII